MLQEQSRQGQRTVASGDVVARATRTAWLRHDPTRNAVLNVLLAGWFRRAALEHPTFLRSARAHIKRDARPGFDRVSRLWALRRQLAGDALLRAQGADVLTLVDEGILGAIHSALVHPQRAAKAEEVEDFVTTMPKPDFVLHLDTPLQVCLDRALFRADPPLRCGDAKTTRQYVSHGHQAYRLAGDSPAFRGRWLTLTPRDTDPMALAREASAFLHCVLSTP
jgi:hypothetical protein